MRWGNRAQREVRLQALREERLDRCFRCLGVEYKPRPLVKGGERGKEAVQRNAGMFTLLPGNLTIVNGAGKRVGIQKLLSRVRWVNLRVLLLEMFLAVDK